MRFIQILLISVLLFSCENSKKPKDLIPEDDLIDVLVEIHIFDAIGADNMINEAIGDIDSAIMYSSILHKYDIDKQQLENTLGWYATQPEKLSQIYDNVFGNLTRISQKHKDELQLFNKSKSNRVYNLPKYIDTRGDTANYPDPIFVNLDSAGTYLVDIKIRMLEEDDSKNPRIRAYFTTDKEEISDSLKVLDYIIVKSNYSRDYQYKVELTDTNFKFLKIIIPVTDDTTNNFRKNIQLSTLKVSILKEESDTE